MTGNRGKFRDVFRYLREWTVCSRRGRQRANKRACARFLQVFGPDVRAVYEDVTGGAGWRCTDM